MSNHCLLFVVHAEYERKLSQSGTSMWNTNLYFCFLKSQLTEKHVVRLSVKWHSEGIDKSIPEHAQYVSDVISHLMKYLKAIIFNIIEEDQSKVSHSFEKLRDAQCRSISLVY